MVVAERRIGWDPWRALRDRDHLVFGRKSLPASTGGGVYWPRGERAAIIVDRSLNRLERLEAVAHELVHDEMGGGCEVGDMPVEWDAIVGREETRVHNEVARRLVPLEVLAAHRAVAEANDLPADVTDVAEWFDVSERVALRAIELLKLARS